MADETAGRVPVLMEGGIRRGTDILNALALGASAVMVGEPVLHALSVGGAILQTELEVAMALTGRARLNRHRPVGDLDILKMCPIRLNRSGPLAALCCAMGATDGSMQGGGDAGRRS